MCCVRFLLRNFHPTRTTRSVTPIVGGRHWEELEMQKVEARGSAREQKTEQLPAARIESA
jgi:hypothetical protein